jgi:aspartate aminotransferase
MDLSNLAVAIESSPTLTLNEIAKKLQSERKPVINLGVGEPTNLAPTTSIEKAAQRLNTGLIKYSSSGGTIDLKNAIIEYTKVNYDRSPSLKNVVVTNGAKQAIFNALFALLNPGDEVILLAPYWVSYPEMIKMAGGIPVVVKPLGGGLEPVINQIISEKTPRTKTVIINNPNNPSGIVFSSDFVRDLVGYCEDQEIFLVMDDIYHKLVYGSKSWVPGYRFTDKSIDDSHIIVINGVSKTYGMTGFRIGWAVASEILIQVMTNIQSQTTSGASIILQDAATGALTGSQDTVNQLCETIKVNKGITLKGLEAIPKIKIAEPEGAFYCFPDFSAYDADSMALSQFLLEKALVAVVPGVSFGLEGHIRISYAGKPNDIEEALFRLRWALDPSSPREIKMGDMVYRRDW